MQKRMCTAHGFTLVELIVVIAIIGILASILVPVMIGYVETAKLSTANSSAKSLYNAAMIACREQDVIKPIPSGVYSKNGVSGAAYNETMCKYIYQYFEKAKDDNINWAVKIDFDMPIAACLEQTPGYMGTYPVPNDEHRAGITLADGLAIAEMKNEG